MATRLIEAILGLGDKNVSGNEFLTSGARVINHGNGITQEFKDNGDETWYKNGELHRDGDLPAVIWDDRQEWYKDGKLHRDDDKPAEIYYGNPGELLPSWQAWYQHGKRHRDGDKPAYVSLRTRSTKGEQRWYKNGVQYRDNDKPSLVMTFDMGIPTIKEWTDKNGKLHRDGDKPAKVQGGQQEWYQHGEKHRAGGKPADIWHDGATQYLDFYRHGKRYKKQYEDDPELKLYLKYAWVDDSDE